MDTYPITLNLFEVIVSSSVSSLRLFFNLILESLRPRAAKLFERSFTSNEDESESDFYPYGTPDPIVFLSLERGLSHSILAFI